jgi:hypothetical protein
MACRTTIGTMIVNTAETTAQSNPGMKRCLYVQKYGFSRESGLMPVVWVVIVRSRAGESP